MKQRPAATCAVTLCLLAVIAEGVGAAPRTATRSERACLPFTVPDVEKILGLKGGAPLVGLEVPFVKGATHDHDGSNFTCQGTIGGRFVSFTFGSRPVTNEGRRQAEERTAGTLNELRKKGYAIRVEQSEGVRCWTLAAPTGLPAPTALFSTTCAGTRGVEFYSVTVSANGPDDLIPMTKLRSLARLAASKLP